MASEGDLAAIEVSSVSSSSNGIVESKCNPVGEQQMEPSRKRKRDSQTAVASTTKASFPQPSSASAYCHEVGAPSSDAAKIAKMAEACKTILECIGEDPSREGLLKTPERWAKALLFMTSGYSLEPEKVLNNAVFESDSHKEIVVVKDIDIHSMCEHHMVPFTGRVHVGYIPDGKSKEPLSAFHFLDCPFA